MQAPTPSAQLRRWRRSAWQARSKHRQTWCNGSGTCLLQCGIPVQMWAHLLQAGFLPTLQAALLPTIPHPSVKNNPNSPWSKTWRYEISVPGWHGYKRQTRVWCLRSRATMCRTFKVTRNRKPCKQQPPYYLAKLHFSLPKLHLENLKQNKDFIRDYTSALIFHINVSISACILDQLYNAWFQAAKFDASFSRQLKKFDGCVMLWECVFLSHSDP